MSELLTTILPTEEEIKTQLLPYENKVVTGENEEESKREIANLRKLATSINENKKRVKKEELKDYTPFENQCKKLLSIINITIENLSSQINTIEELKLQPKKEELYTYFEKNSKDLDIEFEQIVPEEWKNKSCTIQIAEEEIKYRIEEIRRSKGIVEKAYRLKPYWVAVEDKLWETLDLGKTIEYAEKLEEKEIKENSSILRSNELNNTSSIARVNGKIQVEGTVQQITNLQSFMKTNGIKYHIVK